MQKEKKFWALGKFTPLPINSVSKIRISFQE